LLHTSSFSHIFFILLPALLHPTSISCSSYYHHLFFPTAISSSSFSHIFIILLPPLLRPPSIFTSSTSSYIFSCCSSLLFNFSRLSFNSLLFFLLSFFSALFGFSSYLSCYFFSHSFSMNSYLFCSTSQSFWLPFLPYCHTVFHFILFSGFIKLSSVLILFCCFCRPKYSTIWPLPNFVFGTPLPYWSHSNAMSYFLHLAYLFV
jgi:hypothetical protein